MTKILVALGFAALLWQPLWGQHSRPSSRRSTSRRQNELRERMRKADWPRNAPGQAVMPMKLMPITEAPYSRPGEMKNKISGEDLVIGIEKEGVARAYPILMLGGPSREIINDRFGKEPYVVNW